LTDHQNRGLGHALVLRDETARKTREQRLTVFNQVLRHNLSNDLNIILAHAMNISQPTGDQAIERSA